MGLIQPSETFRRLTEPGIAEKAEIWLDYCDRIAGKIKAACLSPRQTIEVCLEIRRKIIPAEVDFPCFGDAEYWQLYESLVRRELGGPGLGEEVVRNVILLDMLFSDLSYAMAADSSPGFLNSMGVKNTIKVKTEDGLEIMFREVDVAAGLVKRESLVCVDTIEGVQIVAEADIPKEAISVWLSGHRDILKRLKGRSIGEGEKWRRGLDNLWVIYLTGRYDCCYAFLPMVENEGDLMVFGVKKLVGSCILGGEYKFDPYWTEGIYTHEGDHLDFMRENPDVRSGTVMEVLADLGRMRHFFTIGHRKYADYMETAVDSMVACLKGERPLSSFPENRVINEMLVTTMTKESWEKVFRMMGITVSVRDNSKLPFPAPLI